ncbi:MAG: hypothetical protein QOJ65_2723 [Fimbriimonadaceae bacterium]|jgi:hypothetical protein|nr:hypothetical protein [Fimbriimonadaceae bacterium]
MFEPSRPGSFDAFLGVGLTTFVDAEIETRQLENQSRFTSLDLNFNVNAPLAGLAPGISVGVLDVADQSPDGRRGYLAISVQDSGGSGPFGGIAPTETTFGFMLGRESHAFVGVSLPLNERFRLLAEADGTKLSGGAEFRTENGPYFRLVFRQEQTLLSVGSTVRF